MKLWNDAVNIFRLMRMGRVMAAHGAWLELDVLGEPPAMLRAVRSLLRFFSKKPGAAEQAFGGPFAAALSELGPSHIKFGQFLATRPDIIGEELSAELSQLQDKLPPFAQDVALKEIEAELKKPIDDLFLEIGEPVAAASIAQVHKARTVDNNKDVAVKILRPGIEADFKRDLSAYFTAARLVERFYAPSRRIRPVAAVQTMADSVKLEMDLRLEAAAISEMTENCIHDPDFKIPQVDWERTSKRVLTTEWIDAIPLNRIDDIKAAKIDMKKLGLNVIQSFLRHALRDGFFHADMHQGNLFVDETGCLIAVDFGIMGRLSPKDRQVLAEILYGFIKRDYQRISEVHFEAGYVPAHQSPEIFAQALRAIGEPLMGKLSEDISMARLLGQLLHVTGQFDMQTQPQLILLQKTMVVVEGVARSLDSELNMWSAAEPVVENFMQSRLGLEGRLDDAMKGVAALGRFMERLPELLDRAGMDKAGEVSLDQQTIEKIAEAKARKSRGQWLALWLIALSVSAIAIIYML